ncbi:MAG: amidohydrolase family protein [Terriglobia bacterium]
MHRLVKMLLALALLPILAGAQTNSEKVALVGARIIDGTGRPPLENATLIIAEGKVQAVGKKEAIEIPPDARKVDLTGKTLMPALVDLHTHLAQTINGLDPAADAYTEQNIRSQLEHLLAYGVGTIAVMGTDRDLIYKLREEQQAGKLPGARFYTGGQGFGAKGGAPGGAGAAWDVNRPDTPEEARAEVRKLAAHHPSYVKIWVDDNYGRAPKMKPEIYRAIIDEAHRHQLRVLAHVYYLADAKSLLAAGVDGLAHSVRDQPVDQELIAALKARNVIYLATLVRDESTFAYADRPAWFDEAFFQVGLLPGVLDRLQSAAFQKHAAADPDLAKNRASLAMAERNLKALYDAGVRVGFGTDAGVPGRFLGYFEHRELQLMVEAGLTPMQAIVCATHNAASFLAKDFGTLRPGQRADFLVLDANPLDDIHNTEKLDAVWQAGKSVHPITMK